MEKQAGFFQTIGAVLSSFFGVRRRKDHEQDIGRLNPVHVILVGVAAAAAFVLTLISVVKMVVK